MSGSTSAVVRPSPSVAQRLRPGYLVQQKLWGVAFLLPVLLLFLGFRLYPMLRAIEISFQRYDLISPPRWVGLDNYAFLISNERVLDSFKVTALFVVGQTIPLVLIALVLAIMLFALPRFRHVFELTFYFPVVMTSVVAALIWLTLFYPRSLLDQVVAPWFPQGACRGCVSGPTEPSASWRRRSGRTFARCLRHRSIRQSRNTSVGPAGATAFTRDHHSVLPPSSSCTLSHRSTVPTCSTGAL